MLVARSHRRRRRRRRRRRLLRKPSAKTRTHAAATEEDPLPGLAAFSRNHSSFFSSSFLSSFAVCICFICPTVSGLISITYTGLPMLKMIAIPSSPTGTVCIIKMHETREQTQNSLVDFSGPRVPSFF
jgi:hypothetical protein